MQQALLWAAGGGLGQPGLSRALIDLHNRNENIPETLEITQLFLPDFHEI